MNCPACAVPLVMTDRQGVEIDYCPQCRGIWLDRGELDKILERSAGMQPSRDRDHRESEYRDPRSWGHGESQHREHSYGEHEKHRKRKGGWLGELFDFD